MLQDIASLQSPSLRLVMQSKEKWFQQLYLHENVASSGIFKEALQSSYFSFEC